MADRVVQLKDKDNNNIFPVASVANAANIRMTDTDPGEGSALEAGNYVAVYGQNGFVETADIADEAIVASKTAFGGNYSLSEVDTGFTWVDGKHIYKKTFDCGKLPNNSAKSIDHFISNIGTVVEMRGTASNGSITFPIPFTSRSNVSDQIEFQVNLTNVSISTHTDYWYNNNYSGYVTIYYTKTS